MALVRPAIVFYENVEQIDEDHKGESPLDSLKADWKSLGYTAQVALVNSKCFGLPQNRDRYIVVGLRSEVNAVLDFTDRSIDTVLKTCRALIQVCEHAPECRGVLAAGRSRGGGEGIGSLPSACWQA